MPTTTPTPAPASVLAAERPAALAETGLRRVLVPLTSLEVTQLSDQETIIGRGLATFQEVGRALAVIRDGRLYRTPDNPRRTFADYCWERWDLGRATAYQLVDASTIVAHLSAMADKPPDNERQCRPLTRLRKPDPGGGNQPVIDLEKVSEVWHAVKEQAEAGAKVTAKLIDKTVKQQIAPSPQPADPPKRDTAGAPSQITAGSGGISPRRT